MNIDRYFIPYLAASSTPAKKAESNSFVGQATRLVRTVSRVALNCLVNSFASCPVAEVPSPQNSPTSANSSQGSNPSSLQQIVIQKPSVVAMEDEKKSNEGEASKPSLVYQQALSEILSWNDDLFAKILKEIHTRKKCFDLNDLPRALYFSFVSAAKTITRLDLKDISLNKDDLEFLTIFMNGLTNLEVSFDQFTEEHINLLSLFSSLEELGLYNAKQFTEEHFQKLTAATRLRILVIKGSLLSNRDYGYLLPTKKADALIKQVLKKSETLLYVGCDDIDLRFANGDDD